MKTTLYLEQYDDGTVIGKWKASGGKGKVGGKLKGRRLKINATGSECSVNYTIRGTLSYDESQIKYTVSGSDDCNGDISGKGKLYFEE